ncbi:MAG: glycosyltransferase family 4 protein [Legionellaceae bacterium]|nr:glycosyltransferase family 4 protein [Legionellaceae bacterium]
MVKQLQQLNKQLKIDVITTQPNRYASYDAEAKLFEQQDNVSIRRIPLPGHRSGMIDQAKAFIYFAKEVNKLIKHQEYSLVFATSSRLMTAVLGTWIARKKKTKLYLDIRDIFVDTIKDVFPKKISMFIQPFFSKLEQWSFARANCINMVSKGFYNYLNTRYPDTKLQFFTNGIDSEFTSFNHDTIPSAPQTRPKSILYAGNIGEGQGLHLIIPELAKQLNGIANFKIIGDGGKKELLKIATVGLNNVELLPPMNRQQLLKEYQQADILFLHLNDYDAFRKVLPSKLFEYAATGAPIWAGVAGYSKEFIQEEIENAAVFNPCNYEEAIKALSTLKPEKIHRGLFIEKYDRSNIMTAMAQDILSTI